MALISFRVVNQKSLRLGEATSVPSVMVIAGPNGVGKSTLLYAIKSGSGQLDPPSTRVLYQGPHRVLRRTTVQRRWLGGAARWLADLLSGGGDVSGYEGLSFPNSTRTPDNVDEAGSTIKHTLGKIENRRQSTLSRIVDTHRANKLGFDPSALPDIYEPVRTLTKYLLPHLEFSQIDFENEDNIRCLWHRRDASSTLELDIDDLSSGEKSIVILFLPLLEDQIRERLSKLEKIAKPTNGSSNTPEDRVMLIDEPEQHLHPDLQAKILAYMRTASRDSRVQFVITTHSPTILDQAFDDELFVLASPSGGATENQLRRVASSAERLEALKQLAGSAYFLTTGRVIICVEGESRSSDGNLSDLALFEILYPRATAFTLVPTRGKGNVINTVQSLREHVPEESFKIRVRGLVDADQSNEQIHGVEVLPVCMIENLLLDVSVIHRIATKCAVAELSEATAVADALRNIVSGLKNEEIALRMQRIIRGWTVRVSGSTLGEIRARQRAEIDRLHSIEPDDAELTRKQERVTARVEQIIAEGKALDQFRGKPILKRLHSQFFAPKNVSYNELCVEIAKLVAQTGAASVRLDPVFDRITS